MICVVLPNQLTGTGYALDSPLPLGEGQGEGIKTVQSFAKQLRYEATDAERLLWRYLRARRLSGFKFRRQMVIEPYIVDFACLEARLVIEADGGQHGEQFERDQCRTAFLEARGYRVLRFWNHEILTQTQAVLEQIHRELIQSPHPNPSPGGRGA